MSLAEEYAETIHDEWQEQFANWPVSKPRELGDYGVLENGVFRRYGNVLKDFDIKAIISNDNNDAVIEYHSSESVDVKFLVKGDLSSTGVKLANAGLEISFHDENAFYFKAAKGLWKHFESPAKLGNEIMDIYEKNENKWKRNWVVITDLLEAKATTVIASKGSKASIVLEAEGGEVPSIDLLNASAKIAVRSENNIGLKVISESGMIPLIGLMKIQRKSLLGLGLIPIGYYWGPER